MADTDDLWVDNEDWADQCAILRQDIILLALRGIRSNLPDIEAANHYMNVLTNILGNKDALDEMILDALEDDGGDEEDFAPVPDN